MKQKIVERDNFLYIISLVASGLLFLYMSPLAKQHRLCWRDTRWNLRTLSYPFPLQSLILSSPSFVLPQSPTSLLGLSSSLSSHDSCTFFCLSLFLDPITLCPLLHASAKPIIFLLSYLLFSHIHLTPVSSASLVCLSPFPLPGTSSCLYPYNLRQKMLQIAYWLVTSPQSEAHSGGNNQGNSDHAN